jgi:PAC2 family
MTEAVNEAAMMQYIEHPTTAASPYPAALPSGPWTLIVPAVTVGNIGQLAVDLLMTVPAATHIGRLHAPDLLPVACPSPLTPAHRTAFVAAVEVYTLSPSLLFLQQRSPPAPGHAAAYASALAKWARSAGCQRIVILASANAAGRRDPQLLSSLSESPTLRIRYAATAVARTQGGLAVEARSRCKFRPMEGVMRAEDEDSGWSPGAPDDDVKVEADVVSGKGKVPAFLPTTRRGSFVRSMLELSESADANSENAPAELVALIMFVHEGDNSADACVMASAVANLLDIDISGYGKGRKAATAAAPVLQALNVSGSADADPIVIKCADELGVMSVNESVGSDQLMSYLAQWKVPAMWQHTVAPPRDLY